MSLYRFPEQIPWKELPYYDKLDQIKLKNTVLDIETYLKDRGTREVLDIPLKSSHGRYTTVYYKEWQFVGLVGYLLGVIDPCAGSRGLEYWNHRELPNMEIEGDDYYGTGVPYDLVPSRYYCGMPTRVYPLK